MSTKKNAGTPIVFTDLGKAGAVKPANVPTAINAAPRETPKGVVRFYRDGVNANGEKIDGPVYAIFLPALEQPKLSHQDDPKHFGKSLVYASGTGPTGIGINGVELRYNASVSHTNEKWVKENQDTVKADRQARKDAKANRAAIREVQAIETPTPTLTADDLKKFKAFIEMMS